MNVIAVMKNSKRDQGLGEAEVQSMIDEDHGAEAVCHFCGNKYQYSEGELEDLLATMK